MEALEDRCLCVTTAKLALTHGQEYCIKIKNP